MSAWRVADLGQAAMLTRCKKLIALSAAQAAGLSIPPTQVLMRTQRGGKQSVQPDLSESVLRPLKALACAEENGRLVLRSVNPERAGPWRAVTVRPDDIGAEIIALLDQHPDLDAILVQAHWQDGAGLEAVLATITPSDCPDERTMCYSAERPNDVRFLDIFDPQWAPILRTYETLESALGVSAEVTLGIERDSVTILSIHCASLRPQLDRIVERAVQHSGLQRQAVGLVADLLENAARPYVISQASQRVRTAGRSIGRAWATGRLSLSAESQAAMLANGDPVILARDVLRPEDCQLFRASAGIVSTTDGISSHYALLAGSLRKPCLVDLPDATVDCSVGMLTVGDAAIKEGDWITVDEREAALLTGRAVPGEPAFGPPPQVLAWAKQLRQAQLLVNCEEAETAGAALAGGADGVGLCRSERQVLAMTNGPAALQAIVQSRDPQLHNQAIDALGAELVASLQSLLMAAGGKPVNYRLIEPAEILAGGQAVPEQGPPALTPLPAHLLRGAAFRAKFAGLIRAQIASALKAARAVSGNGGVSVDLAIIVPMISDVNEYRLWEQFIREEASGDLNHDGLIIRVGAMVETPRAALLAAALAQSSDTLLFGTNDLTSLVWGFERGGGRSSQAGTADPFERFDVEGVGSLMRSAIAEARAANESISITVCGAHASVPDDVGSLMETGANGLSCQLDAIPEVSIQLALHAEAEAGRPVLGLPQASTARLIYARTLARAMEAAEPDEALGELESWAKYIADVLHIEWTGIWKFFKRDLASLWFGQRESRRFMPGWDVDEILAYAAELHRGGSTGIRYSVFPADIACRARSELLPKSAAIGEWRTALAVLDPRFAVEIFAQQPIDRWAFRALLSGGTLSIEGAQGPAIDIFWKAPRELSKFTYRGGAGRGAGLDWDDAFRRLFQAGIEDLHVRLTSMRDFIGADWVSVEGYSGPCPSAPLFVADVDLSLDAALIGVSA